MPPWLCPAAAEDEEAAAGSRCAEDAGPLQDGRGVARRPRLRRGRGHGVDEARGAVVHVAAGTSLRTTRRGKADEAANASHGRSL